MIYCGQLKLGGHTRHDATGKYDRLMHVLLLVVAETAATAQRNHVELFENGGFIISKGKKSVGTGVVPAYMSRRDSSAKICLYQHTHNDAIICLRQFVFIIKHV